MQRAGWRRWRWAEAGLALDAGSGATGGCGAGCRAVLGLLLCMGAALPVRAVDYHLAPGGDDAADGRAAVTRGGSGPWRTLQRLLDLPLAPGDRVLLACGQRFQGPLTLTLRGPAGQPPVVVGPDGSCLAGQAPLIDGRMLLPQGAVDDGTGSGWRAPATVAQVFIDDGVLLPARHPQGRYLLVPPGTAPDKQRLPALAALAGRDLAGARVFARTEEWLLEERVVRSAQGDLATAMQYALRPGSGLFLTGKAWMLDTAAPGWAFDESTGRLHLRNPQRRPVAVALDAPLLRAQGKGALTVVDLAFDGAGGDGISVHTDGEVVLERLRITRSAGNGIAVAGAPSVVVRDSTIAGAGRDGIFFAEADRVVVQGNRVLDAGSYLGPRPALAAINAHRTNAATVDENLVRGSGYIGIRVGGDARVRRNVVEDSCLHLSDCAAIYTWRRNAADLRPPSEISGNLILRVAGDTSVKLGVNDYFSGIYLDDYTRHTVVRGNVIAAVEQGIYLHNAVQNTVSGNLVVDARSKHLVLGVDEKLFKGEGPLGNEISDNADLGAGTAWRVQRPGAPDTRPAAGQRWTLELTGPAAAAGNRQGAAAGCRTLRAGTAQAAAADARTDPMDQPLAELKDCR